VTDNLWVSTDKENRGDGGLWQSDPGHLIPKDGHATGHKIASTLDDETATGWNGEKYLLLSNEVKKARPRPPLVTASRTPGEAVAEKK
jgi:hypothetical protein